MRKSFLTALTLSAALSFVPASFASAAPMSESPMSAAAYDTLYTESSWMTLRVPLTQLGGTIPGNLVLSATGLPSGTSITLVSAAQDGSDAVLTVSVQRGDLTTAVNAVSLIELTSGSTLLTSFNVPVVGVAYGD